MTKSIDSIFTQWSDFRKTLPKEGQMERIYIGSSFCSQYFLRMTPTEAFDDFCEQKGYPITLVIPVFSQKDLQRGKMKISQLLSKYDGMIDEITVNDYGMLYYIRSICDKKLNLGRLFFKDQRDRRVPSYAKGEHSISLLSYKNCGLDFQPHGIEIDRTNEVINLSQIANESIIVSVHAPYCYMTTGNICKFASIHQSLEQKFRPNVVCNLECSHVTERYYDPNHTERGSLFRIGRTLYFLQPHFDTIGRETDRCIYFPAKEVQRWKEVHT